MKKIIITILKIAISAGILAWLAVAAKNDNAFGDLAQQYEDPGFQWGLLGWATLCCAAAVLITLVRWYYLVRALDMPLEVREALRLGFLGYLFNLAPMGIVGGDLLKAIMLAQQNPNRRAQAFATVAVDRVIGLYMLFVVASAAIVLTGFWRHSQPQIRYICVCTLALTGISSAGLASLLFPGSTKGRWAARAATLPYVGRALQHLIEALVMYRRRMPVMLAAAAMSIAVHSLFTIGVYLLTLGIYDGNVQNLTLKYQFIVYPLSSATGVIPLVAGPMEVVLDFLYAQVFGLDKRQGFVVALAYRIVTLLIAMVGVCYYLGARRELAEVMRGAEGEEVATPELPQETAA